MRAELKEIQKALVNYIREQFPGPMKFHFTWELVSNVVEEYLLLHYIGGADIEKAINCIAEMIPEIHEDELMEVIKEVV